MSPAFDPVRLEVLWQRLLTIIEEASWAIIRTSFSVAVRESKDFGCLIYDKNGRMIAQNVTQASKFGVWHTVLDELFRLYPVDALGPGDVFISNDPWLTEGHLYDTTVIAPVFSRGQLVGFAECIAHLADIGGSMRSDSRDLFEEGLQLPIMRLRSGGAENAELIRLIERNVRTPVACMGDIRAMVVSLDVMCSKVTAFIEENRVDDFSALADAIIEATANAMRAGISAALVPGTYRYEITSDGYRRETVLKTTVTVAEGSVDVDYTGSSPESAYGINCCWNYVYGWTTFAVKSIACPVGPVNAGTFQPVKVFAPERTILNPLRPAPVRMRAATGQLVPQLIFGALTGSTGGRAAMAEAGSPLWIQRFFARNADGRGVAEMVMSNGGTGGRADGDGRDAHASPANAGNTPVEVLERALPITLLARELLPDSGGAGKYRGGTGQRVAFRANSGASIRALFQHERQHHAARGAAGGMDGATGRTLVNGREVDGISEFDLVGGDEVVLELPGGGGYGPAYERSSLLLKRDLAAGLVSPAEAKRLYSPDPRS
jgi:N-methylhydantoinase B